MLSSRLRWRIVVFRVMMGFVGPDVGEQDVEASVAAVGTEGAAVDVDVDARVMMTRSGCPSPSLAAW